MRPPLCSPLAAFVCLIGWAEPAAGRGGAYEAVAAADGVPVHAGPPADGKDAYVTAMLDRGTKVRVERHDAGGWAMVRPPAGAFSFAKANWLTFQSGSAEAGGTAVVSADGAELYCRVGSRLGEPPMIEQVPLKKGQAVTVLGAVTLEGPDGPEAWVTIPSPPGEGRWVLLKHLVPVDPAARRARDDDPYSVPSDLTAAPTPGTAAPGPMAVGFPTPGQSPAGGVVQTAAADPFAPFDLPTAGEAPAVAAAPAPAGVVPAPGRRRRPARTPPPRPARPAAADRRRARRGAG